MNYVKTRTRMAATALLAFAALALGHRAHARPDLIVRVVPPTVDQMRAGRDNPIEITVVNIGDQPTPAGSCIKVFTKSSSSNMWLRGVSSPFLFGMCSDNLDAGDTTGQCWYGLNSRDGWCKVGSLSPGESISYGLNVYPRYIGGYAMTVTVDPGDRIRENSNRNNTTVIPVPVTR
jgi:hypothetical protein